MIEEFLRLMYLLGGVVVGVLVVSIDGIREVASQFVTTWLTNLGLRKVTLSSVIVIDEEGWETKVA